MSKASKKPTISASVNTTGASSSLTASGSTVTGSANFMAISNSKPLSNPFREGINADMTSLGVQSCYIPSTTSAFPEVPGNSNISGDWTIPSTNPWPGVAYPYIAPYPRTFTTTEAPEDKPKSYWGVDWGIQKKKDPTKGGPEFWVVNPTTISLLSSAHILARFSSENDATYICRLLNEDHERMSAGPAPEKAKAKKTCSCDGVTSMCSDCCIADKKATVEPDHTISYGHARDRFKSLEGRVLTILDASISNDVQNKALKSLVKREFRSAITGIYEFLYRDCSEGDAPDLDGSGDDCCED